VLAQKRRSNKAWSFVRDEPRIAANIAKLPELSRGATQPVVRALAGKATVFIDPFDNARDSRSALKKAAEVMPDVRKKAVALLLAWARSA
jgi:hypothetical protein